MDYLEQFFEQGIFPAEELTRPSGTDYAELEAQYGRLKGALIKNLSEEQQKLFEQVMEIRQHIGIFDMSASFARGFKIGGRLISEIYRNT